MKTPYKTTILYFPDPTDARLDALIANEVYKRYEANLYIVNPTISKNTVKEINDEYLNFKLTDIKTIIGVGLGAIYAQLITDSCAKILFDPMDHNEFFKRLAKLPSGFVEEYELFKEEWSEIDAERRAGTISVLTPFNKHNGYHSMYSVDFREQTGEAEKWVHEAFDAVDKHFSKLHDYYIWKDTQPYIL